MEDGIKRGGADHGQTDGRRWRRQHAFQKDNTFSNLATPNQNIDIDNNK
jgi:hypothetical protein